MHLDLHLTVTCYVYTVPPWTKRKSICPQVTGHTITADGLMSWARSRRVKTWGCTIFWSIMKLVLTQAADLAR